ncbi:MAG: ABC transporter permease [Actinomycetota bacterium]|nr:ABC transporter permease [Actinomycetota bacterium]
MAAAAPRPETRRRGRPGRGGPRYPGWLSLPALAWYVAFFVCPLGIMAVFSFSRREGFTGIVYDFNLENYDELIDPLYGEVFTRTLGMATFGTVATLIIGFPLAYYIARWAKHKTLLLLLVVVPFWTSILIRTYSWLIILDPEFPLFDALRAIGLVGNDYNLLYTTEAIYIGVVYNYLPLMVLPLYAALERMDWSLVEAAQDLGDGPVKAFRRVTLPLVAPGMIAGSLLVFIPLMGEYLNPVILGGDKTVYVGNLIGQQFLTSRDWPFGSAIAMVVILSMTVVVLIYSRLVSREEAYGG